MKIFTASFVLPIASPPIGGGGIAVENGRIVDVGPAELMRRRYDGPVTDFPDGVLMPGLVNAHTHLELTHFPSWKIRKDIDYSPRTYVDWIIQVIKIKRSLQPEELELSLKEGLRISLESGTVAAADILSNPDFLHIYDQSPATNLIFLEALGQDSAACATLIKKLEKAITSSPGRFGLSPHSPFTLSSEFFQEIHKLATRLSVPTMTHLSESVAETAFMHDSTGAIAELLYPHIKWECYLPPPRRTNSTGYLQSLGVIDPSTIAVHCVHVTPAEAQILKTQGARIVVCPRSNEKLDVGKAPLHLFKKLGIPLALGTDSLASNDSLSLWDEMRFIQKDSPGVFQYDELLQMATLGGASVLGIEKEFGSLEKGKKADFIVMGLKQIPPVMELPEQLVEAGCLQDVYIAGDQLHQHQVRQ